VGFNILWFFVGVVITAILGWALLRIQSLRRQAAAYYRPQAIILLTERTPHEVRQVYCKAMVWIMFWLLVLVIVGSSGIFALILLGTNASLK